VLLLNNGQEFFSGPTLAKLFAQVTTEARKLDDLHDAWLTFAFDLGKYSAANVDFNQRKQAMTAVARLCNLPQTPVGNTANPFHDRIRFNPNSSPSMASPSPGGFRYDCTDLADLIYRYYYNCAPVAGNHLSPVDLASQIILAHKALVQVVQAPQDKTVFFGDDEYAQKTVQDAWFVGVLTGLLTHGVPRAWLDLFRQLNFHSTAWNFKSWVGSLGGREAGRSRDLARRVFHEAFKSLSLPANTQDLSSCFQGDAATLTLEFSELTPSGRPSSLERMSQELPVSATRSVRISPRTHVKLRGQTLNISYVTIHDNTVRGGALREYAQELRSGLVLDTSQQQRPWTIAVNSTHYGGVQNELKLTIDW